MGIIVTFLESLLSSGQPFLGVESKGQLGRIDEIINSEGAELGALFNERYASACEEFPGRPLLLNTQAALWGAKVLFLLSSATVIRELENRDLEHICSFDLPDATPEAHFSADLFLSYLPDLQRIILNISDGDPLLALIEKVALQVPLSSVGMQFSGQPNLDVILSHKGLSQVHAERVIDRADSERANVSEVKEVITQLTGNYPSFLAGNLIRVDP